ncbi:hypothetical protein Sjap_023196 [Stephania japonica]|uniref:BHLH domain-containing protein n=1 Tax=Stephania japonica TaxID=461633 RepID=A0AAP0EB77_9MAGN
MAAFPYQQQQPTFLLDSVFLSNNNPIKVSDLLAEAEHTSTTSFSYCYYPSQTAQKAPIDATVQDNSCLDSTINVLNSDNEQSVTQKHHNNPDSSSIVLEIDSGDHTSQGEGTTMDKRRNRGGSCMTSTKSEAVKESRAKKQRKCKADLKETEENKKKTKCHNKNQKQVLQDHPPNGYIHVRARRGQATDSHSLAERVRREKISERMRLLQGLVPGCDKVTGKALVLDEIINYVQSLQYQVEFLSMKLASANPTLYNFAADLDSFIVKSEKPSTMASSPLSPIQQSSPITATAFGHDTQSTLTIRNNLFSQEGSQVSFPLQGQKCIGFSQENGNLLWEVDDHRQKSINECGFNNSCSFQ